MFRFLALASTLVCLALGEYILSAGDVRLVSNSDSSCNSGRVEIYNGNEWGTVGHCPYYQSYYSMGSSEIEQVCEALGFTYYSSYNSTFYYGYADWYSKTYDTYNDNSLDCNYDYISCYSYDYDLCDDCTISTSSYTSCEYQTSSNSSCHVWDIYAYCEGTSTYSCSYYSDIDTYYGSEYTCGYNYSIGHVSSALAAWIVAVIVISILFVVCLPIIIVALVCGGVACCAGAAASSSSRNYYGNQPQVITTTQVPMQQPMQQGNMQYQQPMTNQHMQYSQQPQMMNTQPMQMQQMPMQPIQQPMVYSQPQMANAPPMMQNEGGPSSNDFGGQPMNTMG